MDQERPIGIVDVMKALNSLRRKFIKSAHGSTWVCLIAVTTWRITYGVQAKRNSILSIRENEKSSRLSAGGIRKNCMSGSIIKS
jgi:hypothetical protein